VPRHSEATLAAIKRAVDIVSLVNEYLPLTRSGSKYKALCPFHDDHNPSLELNPERQSFKCWSCGAGGDVFDFVKDFERVEFPEALKMLAERAGVALDEPAASAAAPGGVSKSELLAVLSWAEGVFAEALTRSEPARGYVVGRGINDSSVARFRLGYAPGERGWLTSRAKRAGFPLEVLERSGLVSRPEDVPVVRERFRGRLMFPIHDARGRTVGFGGRVLPEVERHFAAAGKRVAKYLNSPETLVFQKRRLLYAADLARTAARETGWVAVVEGYTDVIAAHQAGLANVVGTLGTALGDDHVTALRRLADRVVLVFDGDDAGQNAADRALELFLGHEVDMRVLTLPENLDPCDFLLREGAEAFRGLVDRAVDPLDFALSRAAERFDLESIEGSRQASEWVLEVFARVNSASGSGSAVKPYIKIDKAIEVLARRLRVPVAALHQRWREIRQRVWRERSRPRFTAAAAEATPPAHPPIDASALDRDEKELIEVVVNRPDLVPHVARRVAASTLREAPLRTILEASYDLFGEGVVPTFEVLTLRLEDPAIRAFTAGLLLPDNPSERSRHPIDPQPLAHGTSPGPWELRLERVLAKLAERDRVEHIRQVKAALDEAREANDSEASRALLTEYLRLTNQRPDTKKKTAS
jgi:DNA primase